jgi:hypothetical protein
MIDAPNVTPFEGIVSIMHEAIVRAERENAAQKLPRCGDRDARQKSDRRGGRRRRKGTGHCKRTLGSGLDGDNAVAWKRA